MTEGGWRDCQWNCASLVAMEDLFSGDLRLPSFLACRHHRVAGHLDRNLALDCPENPGPKCDLSTCSSPGSCRDRLLCHLVPDPNRHGRDPDSRRGHSVLRWSAFRPSWPTPPKAGPRPLGRDSYPILSVRPSHHVRAVFVIDCGPEARPCDRASRIRRGEATPLDLDRAGRCGDLSVRADRLFRGTRGPAVRRSRLGRHLAQLWDPAEGRVAGRPGGTRSRSYVVPGRSRS